MYMWWAARCFRIIIRTCSWVLSRFTTGNEMGEASPCQLACPPWSYPYPGKCRGWCRSQHQHNRQILICSHIMALGNRKLLKGLSDGRVACILHTRIRFNDNSRGHWDTYVRLLQQTLFASHSLDGGIARRKPKFFIFYHKKRRLSSIVETSYVVQVSDWWRNGYARWREIGRFEKHWLSALSIILSMLSTCGRRVCFN